MNDDVAALVWGNPERPVWLALHGWLDNAASFSRLAPLLVERLDVCIVAVDLPGHGESVHRSHEMDYAPWGYASDVRNLLDELGVERVTLLGHSMGAIIANLFAASFPERIEHLILLDGLVGKLMAVEDTALHVREGIIARQKANDLPVRRFASVENAIATRVRKSVLPISREAAEPIMRRNLKPVEESGAVELTTDEKLKQPRTMLFTEDQAIAVLRATSAPVLLVLYQDGSVVSRDPDRRFRGALKHLAEVTIPGGHHVHVEQKGSDIVVDAIVQWYRQH